MSDENPETILDIASEMREFADTDSQSIGRDVLRRRIQWFAGRIEQLVTVCNQLGNAANMRKALEQISNMGEQIDYQLGSSEETVYAFRNERCIAHNISECARSALSALPRNCDRPECATTKSAQDTWRMEDGGKTAYYEWLLATSTKGETSGSK